MKVLLVNGSPHSNGSTYTALSVIAEELSSYGVESEIINLGIKPISGCMACYKCRETNAKKCIIDDIVNEFIEKAKDADGFVFGSPVYFAGASGQITSFLNRVFYCGRDYLSYKPAFSVVCGRRCGHSSTYDQLNKYIGFNNMLQVPSKYWNVLIGRSREEILNDSEGLEIIKHLSRNMVWILNMLDNAKKNGIER